MSNESTADKLRTLLRSRRKLMSEKEAVTSLLDDTNREILGILASVDAIPDHLKEEGVSGSATINTPAGKFVVERSKTVSWDSDALSQVAAGMSADDVRAIFKMKLSLDEATFNDLAELEHPLIDNIRLARTVKVGELKLKDAKEA